jgi:hypothetical protein
MDEYIRADNDLHQRREEAYRYSEMTRGFRGRLHPRHVRTIHNPNANDERANNARAVTTSHSLRACSKLITDHQLREAEGGEASAEGGTVISPGNCSAFFYGEDKGHTTRTCQVTIQKQKEIAEAKARQNQLKQVLHTASCYSPYIPEYVGNQQPTASAASASHSQGSWAQLPPPPLLAPPPSHD